MPYNNTDIVFGGTLSNSVKGILSSVLTSAWVYNSMLILFLAERFIADFIKSFTRHSKSMSYIIIL